MKAQHHGSQFSEILVDVVLRAVNSEPLGTDPLPIASPDIPSRLRADGDALIWPVLPARPVMGDRWAPPCSWSGRIERDGRDGSPVERRAEIPAVGCAAVLAAGETPSRQHTDLRLGGHAPGHRGGWWRRGDSNP